jgi:hypothetical protein
MVSSSASRSEVLLSLEAEEEWSLDTLYKAAAAFPSKVARCPQRTWAILTPYTHTKNFVVWAADKQIKVPHFDGAEMYTSDLLDMYMEYKFMIGRIQGILANPLEYVISPVTNAFSISIDELLQVRKDCKAQMKLITGEMDTM